MQVCRFFFSIGNYVMKAKTTSGNGNTAKMGLSTNDNGLIDATTNVRRGLI